MMHDVPGNPVQSVSCAQPGAHCVPLEVCMQAPGCPFALPPFGPMPAQSAEVLQLVVHHAPLHEAVPTQAPASPPQGSPTPDSEQIAHCETRHAESFW